MDWAKAHHEVGLLDADNSRLAKQRIENEVVSIGQLAALLLLAVLRAT